MKPLGIIFHSALALAVGTTVASAADIRVFTPRALWTVLQEIGPDFERVSGHRLDVVTDLAPTLAGRLERGDSVELFIGPPFVLQRLQTSGRIRIETRTPLARSGIGMSVRAGAPKPDIITVDGFKRALLEARSIAYLKTGASGVYLAKLVERLGLTEALDTKTVRPDTDIVSELVAKGEVQYGLVVTTQIVTTPGVDLVGPIPAELQSYVEWDAVVAATARSPDAARVLISFLRSPRAADVMRRQGMEPR